MFKVAIVSSPLRLVFRGSVQVAIMRVCATTGTSGVPVGTHMAIPVMMSSGWPSEVTRTAPTAQCAVTQGPLPAGGGGMAHPATAHGAESVATGIPLTSTR
jgi:hypothetical protein